MNILSSRKLAVAAVVIIGVLGLGLGKTHALIMTDGCGNVNQDCTLQELFDGGSITIQDNIFDNFEPFLLDSSSTLPDVSLIVVNPLDDQLDNPGLGYDANDQLTTTGFVDLIFGFTVAIVDSPLRSLGIKDNTLTLVDFAFGGEEGVITIFETIRNADFTLQKSKFVGVDQSFPEDNVLSASAEFGLQSLIFVETDILIEGDFIGPGTVALNAFEQRFSQEPIPEPGTLLLIGSGLAGLGATSWRRSRRK